MAHCPVRTQYTYSSTIPEKGTTVLRAGVASAKTVPAAFRRAGSWHLTLTTAVDTEYMLCNHQFRSLYGDRVLNS